MFMCYVCDDGFVFVFFLSYFTPMMVTSVMVDAMCMLTHKIAN
jgi:hypothetical protein